MLLKLYESLTGNMQGETVLSFQEELAASRIAIKLSTKKPPRRFIKIWQAVQHIHRGDRTVSGPLS